MPPDFLELLSAFLNAGVDFLLVGGHAVGAHGLPRATDDLDVWVRPTPDNAARVFAALAKFGAPLRDVSPADFAKDDTIYQIGVPPLRVDVLTGIEGVRFGTAWPRRMMVAVGSLSVPVIGREDLLTNKRAVGRPQDLADVARLESMARISPPNKDR